MCLAHYSHDYTPLLNSLTRILDLEYSSLRRAIQSVNTSSSIQTKQARQDLQSNGIVVVVISEHLDGEEECAVVSRCGVVIGDGRWRWIWRRRGRGRHADEALFVRAAK
jgi:hypothetical protein